MSLCFFVIRNTRTLIELPSTLPSLFQVKSSLRRLSKLQIRYGLFLVGVFGVLVLIDYIKSINKYRHITSSTDVRPPISDLGDDVIDVDSQANIVDENLNKIEPETGSFPEARSCTDDFRNSHLMTGIKAGRTGNYLFKIATLLATANMTCYRAVRTSTLPYKRCLDDIFYIRNFEPIEGNLTFEMLQEPGYATYDPDIVSKVKPGFNYTLMGFRQSYRYFQNHTDYIRSSLVFKHNIVQDVHKYLEDGIFHGKPKVCIHVRRKDMTDEVSTKFGRLPASVEFINDSITYMKEYLQPSNFTLFVVSDDKPWCKENIKGDNVYLSPFTDSGRDLYLLTQCDHNIVTSGTFGWMGAWLNETGVVIYNKMYPMPNSPASVGFVREDYYPSHWIGM